MVLVCNPACFYDLYFPHHAQSSQSYKTCNTHILSLEGAAAQVWQYNSNDGDFAQYLCGKIIAELELLEECRHDDCRKEENDTPEENIRNVRSVRAAGGAYKLPSLFNAVLQEKSGAEAFRFIGLAIMSHSSGDFSWPQKQVVLKMYIYNDLQH